MPFIKLAAFIGSRAHMESGLIEVERLSDTVEVGLIRPDKLKMDIFEFSQTPEAETVVKMVFRKSHLHPLPEPDIRHLIVYELDIMDLVKKLKKNDRR